MEHVKANTIVQLPPQKILVIDDEDDYRTMIRVTLKMIGYDVIEASNGLDGLAAARMHHPDLVLCDIKMPEMDGYTLLGRLKEYPACAAIPFIFLTGNTAKNDMRQGMQRSLTIESTQKVGATVKIKLLKTMNA